MNRHTAKLTPVIAAAAVITAALPALATSVPVTVTSSAGTRTLTLSSADGTALDATHGLSLGSGKTASIVAAVTDSNYGHNGYQVSSTMTNLYPISGPTYNFAGTPVPSSAISVAVPAVALDLANVNATIAPVVTLSGNLTTALAAIATLLPLGTNLTSVTTTVTGAPQSLAAVATHVTDGTLAALPLATTGASAGAFTTPATLGTGDPATGTGATTKVLMNSTLQTGNLAALTSSLNTAFSAKTVAQLITDGVFDTNSVLTALANTLGIATSLLQTVNQSTLLAALSPSVTSLVGGLLGQSGTSSSNSTLTLATPANLPAGTYRGVLTVTMADVP
jgi:hypothetical protein